MGDLIISRIVVPARSFLKKAVLKIAGGNRRIIDPLKALDAKLRKAYLPPVEAAGRGRAGDLEKIKAAPFGVNVAGHFRGEFGLGEAARSDARCLDAAGVPYAMNNIAVLQHSEKDESAGGKFSLGNPYRFNLVHVNIDSIRGFMNDRGGSYFSGKYNIASWVWEAPVVPEKFLPEFKYFDEIWTLSRYSMDILSRVSPVPVVRMPCSIDKTVAGVRPDKARFGLGEEEFAFLTMFDFRSFMDRKNPLAAVRAFRAAFSAGDKARLVVKHINSNMHKDDLAALNKELEGLNVKVIDGHLRRDEVVSLIASCDCTVSLHRAEGFGLTLAEAMALGKPVIATDYSGNTDFMNAGNSFPVKYRLVELERDFPPYVKGGFWADPDVDHAASLMRLVYEDRALAEVTGRRAMAEITERFSPAAVGELYRQRLTHIERHIL
jgi:glycosyltransferase involved in cell wall biosynthesis